MRKRNLAAVLLVIFGLFLSPQSWAKKECSSLFGKFASVGPQLPTTQVLDRSRNKDFFDLRDRFLSKKNANKKVDEWNNELIEALGQQLPPSLKRKSGVTEDEAKDLYQYLNCHPVAGMKSLKKYDPKGNFGFCFGRATAVHLEALRRGLERERVIKIWGVGPMKGGWGHHVATLVAGKEGGWWAIDPEVGKVVSATDWIKWLKAEQENGDEPLVFFVSEAERFGPTADSKYNQVDLYGSDTDDLYNGYFRHLIRGEH